MRRPVDVKAQFHFLLSVSDVFRSPRLVGTFLENFNGLVDGEDGVAVCSRYDLLKGTPDLLADRVFVGRVEYGYRHLWASKHENLLRLITTKREEYAHEREVRAFLLDS